MGARSDPVNLATQSRANRLWPRLPLIGYYRARIAA